ncbi:uncharacterized protein LOC121372054 [Gigantopelta aegis]|uniref:uncharacterized protein LOC121372054 n=1 Tax=Gigantopelta aegis TaxID=1735272 RepID=UPI001B88B895|nr:uncharacterized protein LOC121372054 [Gigantopelta aegis]
MEDDEQLVENARDSGISRTFDLSEQSLKFIRTFLRGFGSGAALYAGFKVVGALTRNPFRKGIPNILTLLRRDYKDLLRFAGFLALYPSVYHLCVDLLKYYRQKQDGWTHSIAGGVASFTVIVENDSRRTFMTFFAIARALGAGLSTLVARETIPAIPFFDIMTFSACGAYIVYSAAVKPSNLSEGYYRSLLKWSRGFTDASLARIYRLPGDRFISCQEAGMHSDTCTKHALKDFFQSLLPFASLYLPIHLTPILVFRRKLLIERPKKTALSLVKNLFYSSAFLSSMVMLAKYTMCVLRNFEGKPPPAAGWIPSVAGVVCGLSLLWERVNRRKELAMFLIPHTLLGIYKMGLKSSPRLVSSSPLIVMLLFAVSMMTLMHAYERQPGSLTPLLGGLLKYFVGTRITVLPHTKHE